MARTGTALLNLGTWTDGENPGAGSQSVDSLALNGNWIKLDTAVGTEHNANGTHKSAVIDKGNLKTTVADGITIELDGSNGLQVKDLGIDAAALGALAVTTAKINDLAVTNAKIAAATIGSGKFAAQAIATADIADDAVTAAKTAHDHTGRKCLFLLGWDSGTSYTKFEAIIHSASIHGVPMPRAGAVTGLSIENTAGTVYTATVSYSPSALNHFTAGQRLKVRDDTFWAEVYKDGTSMTNVGPRVDILGTTPRIVTVEVEFDD